MKQLIQSYKTGDMEIADIPVPVCGEKGVIVRNLYSLISAGTEKTLIDLAKKSLLGKARARPDLLKQVINRVQQEGLWSTWEKVKSRLDNPVPLGYSCAGEVAEVGGQIKGISPGDRVSCAGAGYANHAEYNFIPHNLCVKVPDSVSMVHASFATVGAIAMQGVRQGEVSIGENAAVLGLGLIGLLTVQILKAAGCRVIGYDPDPFKADLAQKTGCDTAVCEGLHAEIESITGGYGADSVIITASATSSEPVETAGEISRQKGTVVCVGMTGMEVPRDIYYKKELDLRLSMSYGPGRYDYNYEEGGMDYPYGYVRWTEKRNMQSFLQLVDQNKIDLDSIITHRFPFEKAIDAYNVLEHDEKYVGIVLEYSSEEQAVSREPITIETGTKGKEEEIRIGWVGAGGFAKGVLMPAFKRSRGHSFEMLCDADGTAAKSAASNFGFKKITGNFKDIISDENINTVVITTPHNLHASQVLQALEAGKHVHVEKPLALRPEELEEINEYIRGQGEGQDVLAPRAPECISGLRGLRQRRGGAENETGKEGGSLGSSDTGSPMYPAESRSHEDQGTYSTGTNNEQRTIYSERGTSRRTNNDNGVPILHVGYNRRFSGILNDFKEYFDSVRTPLVVHYRINCGVVPRDHWIQDPEVGGGRIIGEVCHFIDLCSYLCGSLPKDLYARSITAGNESITDEDSVNITLGYENGSLASVSYAALGDTMHPKERIEVTGGGSIGVLENFKSGFISRGGKKQKIRRSSQDKGFAQEIEAFLKAVKEGGPAPIPFDHLYSAGKATFSVLESLRTGGSVRIK